MDFVVIIGLALILVAMIGSHWMFYRAGYFKGLEHAAVWQYERELEREFEEREDFNANYEELPALLKNQAE